ncbi:MAG: SIMPL domain-containing protein [bacterium]|nr:SIMPL domain-containing protein [bacterium]
MASEKDNNGGLFFIAIAIVAASFILGIKMVEMRKAGDMISVTGSAKRPIVSDLIVWSGNVGAQENTQQDAYRSVQTHAERLKRFFKEHSLPDAEVTMKTVSSEQIQEYNEHGMYTGRTLGFRVNQSFEIRSTRVEAIEELIKKSDQLISEGLPFQGWGAQYLYTKLADLRIEMLGEAMKDATERAKVMAESSGAKLGELRDAKMGVFQVTPRNSTDVSDYGYYDTSSKEKDITAVVKASYSLD